METYEYRLIGSYYPKGYDNDEFAKDSFVAHTQEEAELLAITENVKSYEIVKLNLKQIDREIKTDKEDYICSTYIIDTMEVIKTVKKRYV